MQHRIDNINLRAAALTNITHEHLDYHETFTNYVNAKLLLFSRNLRSGKTAVLNSDIPYFNKFKVLCIKKNINVLSYGYKSTNLTLSSLDKKKIKIFGNRYTISNNDLGGFQIYNLLAAIGLAVSCDIKLQTIIDVIPQIQPPIGRAHLVTRHKGGYVYVDYAHTPDALMNILQYMRSLHSGLIHLLFGCGGNRDQNKRRLMGSIANRLADRVYITDDNPRTEDPYNIKSEIMKTCLIGIDCGDRGNAIAYAMQSLKKNDILVIAGKGHENYQIIGTKKYFFSDYDHIKKHSL